MSSHPHPDPLQPGAQSRREMRLREQTLLRITLLRHGEPDWFPGGGRSVDDAGLTARGRAQAAAAARALAQEPLDAIYVSPLRRAQETAAPLAAATGVAAVTAPALAEIGVPGSGLTQPEVDEFFLQASKRPLSEHWEGWPGGESFHDFHARVTTAIEAILAHHKVVPAREHDFTVWEHPPRRLSIAIVAHGGTNAVLATHLLDVRPVPWEWMRFEAELASYSVLVARPIGTRGSVWSLQNFNEVDHLRAEGLR